MFSRSIARLLPGLLAVQDVVEPVKEVSDCHTQSQDRKPVLSDQRQDFIPVGQTLVFHKLLEEDIAPDGTQPKGDWIEDQPEEDIFCSYRWPVFLSKNL